MKSNPEIVRDVRLSGDKMVVLLAVKQANVLAAVSMALKGMKIDIIRHYIDCNRYNPCIKTIIFEDKI